MKVCNLVCKLIMNGSRKIMNIILIIKIWVTLEDTGPVIS